MLFTPASILGMWFRGLLSIAILLGGAYLLYRWQEELPRMSAGDGAERRELTSFGERLEAWRPGLDTTTALLAGGVVLLGWAGLGSWVYPRALRSSGGNRPDDEQRGETQTLQRPDGTRLHVESFGPADAPRLILTHGWGCDRSQWNYVRRHFAGKYRVIVWDLPGLGRSTQPTNHDFSLAKLAADLRAVIESTGAQPAILVGHSIGGMTTLTYCKLFGEQLHRQVVGLVLAHTTYTNPLKTASLASFLTAIQKPVIEPLLSLTIVLSPLVWVMNCLSYLNGSAHRSTERQSFARTETKEQLDFAARYSVKASPKVVARGAFGMLGYDVTSALAEINLPTLVVTGNQDMTTKPEAGEFINSQVPQSRLSSLVPAKHLGFFEHYDRFNQWLDQFASTVFDSSNDATGPAGVR